PFRADFPNFVQLRVVDLHQLAGLVAKTQAEPFVKLESFGPGVEALFESLGFAVAPVGIVDPVEINEREGEEPTGMCIVEGRERLREPIAPAAVKIDDRADARLVQFGEIALDALGGERG